MKAVPSAHFASIRSIPASAMIDMDSSTAVRPTIEGLAIWKPRIPEARSNVGPIVN